MKRKYPALFNVDTARLDLPLWTSSIICCYNRLLARHHPLSGGIMKTETAKVQFGLTGFGGTMMELKPPTWLTEANGEVRDWGHLCGKFSGII